MNWTKSLALVAVLASPGLSFASLYSDDFNTNSSANYNVYITPGATGPSSDATFLYDYSALGIPSAPHTSDASTLGLRLRVDNLQSSTNPPNVLGAIE